MTNTFFRDISDLPDPDEDSTQPIIVPPLEAHGAVLVVVMLTPEGRIAGEVMRDSFAHRAMIAGGFYELEVQQ